MTLFLNSKNVFNYLLAEKICTQEEQHLSKVELKDAKNFNLLLTLQDGRKLLVKQERYNQEGKTAGEFLGEWQIQEFIVKTPQLSHIRPFISEMLHFDVNHSIIIFNYLNDYGDVADFYIKKNAYPTTIAASIGKTLATIHRDTLDCQKFQDFLFQNLEDVAIGKAPSFIHGIERISPEVFGQFPADGLKFFALYQRYDSLGTAIAELNTAFKPCCLTHNDLKLNNILLHNDWEQPNNSIIRLIDWERGAWGDPAFDLGMLVASYLQIWLDSLVVNKSIDIEESLRLAMTPLDIIQPSIVALAKAYFNNFPEIIGRRPNFLRRVVQFSGFALIQQIQAMLQYQKSFGNTGICMLQIAKSILCRPEESIPTIFGVAECELTHLNDSLT